MQGSGNLVVINSDTILRLLQQTVLESNGSTPASTSANTIDERFIYFGPLVQLLALLAMPRFMFQTMLEAIKSQFRMDALEKQTQPDLHASLAAGLSIKQQLFHHISFVTITGNFNQYSTATLYGIKTHKETTWQTQRS
jgi:hypothetical protein